MYLLAGKCLTFASGRRQLLSAAATRVLIGPREHPCLLHILLSVQAYELGGSLQQRDIKSYTSEALPFRLLIVHLCIIAITHSFEVDFVDPPFDSFHECLKLTKPQ